jgi:hypothetical protein
MQAVIRSLAPLTLLLPLASAAQTRVRVELRPVPSHVVATASRRPAPAARPATDAMHALPEAPELGTFARRLAYADQRWQVWLASEPQRAGGGRVSAWVLEEEVDARTQKVLESRRVLLHVHFACSTRRFMVDRRVQVIPQPIPVPHELLVPQPAPAARWEVARPETMPRAWLDAACSGKTI